MDETTVGGPVRQLFNGLDRPSQQSVTAIGFFALVGAAVGGRLGAAVGGGLASIAILAACLQSRRQESLVPAASLSKRPRPR